jgi:dihydrofolate reductase
MSPKVGVAIYYVGRLLQAFAMWILLLGYLHGRTDGPCAQPVLRRRGHVHRWMADGAGAIMRRVRYQVAVSLDGFIAGPKGEYDWIVMDPSIDFERMYKEYDTAVMGRRTYEVVGAMGSAGMPGLDVIVFSRTLPSGSLKGARVANDAREEVAALKKKRGGDIWLFGGGELFRSLLDARLVDTVEVAVIPVLLGEGNPLLPPGRSAKLKLVDQKILPNSGIVVLSYLIEGRKAPGAPIAFVKEKPARKAARRRSRRKVR